MSAPIIIQLPPVNFGAPIFTSKNSYDTAYNLWTAFCLDDDSVGVIAFNSGDQSLDIYIIDKSGAFTFYSTGPLSNPIVPGYGLRTLFPSGLVRLSLKFFYVSVFDAYSGGLAYTFAIQLQNAKLNNSIPIPIRQQFALTNPCNMQGPQFFYDAVKNILAVGFYAPTGQYGGPVNASFYAPSDRGLQLLQTGFVGYYYNGFDPFNKSQSINGLTYIANTQNQQANGVNTKLFYDQHGYGIAASSYAVNMGAATNCDTPSGAEVTSRISNAFYFDNYNSGDSTWNLDTTLFGVTGAGGNFNNLYGLQLFAGPNIYNVTLNGLFTRDSLTFALNRSGYYVVDINNNNQVTVYFSAASPPIGYNEFFIKSHMLINAHRPVSIFGRYKT